MIPKREMSQFLNINTMSRTIAREESKGRIVFVARFLELLTSINYMIQNLTCKCCIKLVISRADVWIPVIKFIRRIFGDFVKSYVEVYNEAAFAEK